MKMLRVDVDAEVGEMGRGLGKAVPKPIPFEKPKRQPEGLPKGVVVNEKGQWGYDPGKVPPQGAMASSAAATDVDLLKVGDWVRRKNRESLGMRAMFVQIQRIYISLNGNFAEVFLRGNPFNPRLCAVETLELSPWQFSQESPE